MYDLGENPASQSSKCECLETEACLTHLKRKKEAAVVEEGKREGVGWKMRAEGERSETKAL